MFAKDDNTGPNNFGGESDIIETADQINISKIAEEKFEKYNIIPPPVTLTPDLDHITDSNTRDLVKDLLGKYDEVFSKSRYDCGTFTAFSAEINVDPDI